MRAHTLSGTGPELALAPEPTAAWFAGNRVFGSAPASGTGASVVFADGGDGVVAQDPVVVAGVVGDGVLLEVDPVNVKGVAAGVGVLTSFETDEPALQPARARQVSVLAHTVPLVVPLRRIVRSVRLASGVPSLTRGLRSFSLAADKGLSITVKFLMSEDASLQTSFVVDDTAVTTG